MPNALQLMDRQRFIMDGGKYAVKAGGEKVMDRKLLPAADLSTLVINRL